MINFLNQYRYSYLSLSFLINNDKIKSRVNHTETLFGMKVSWHWLQSNYFRMYSEINLVTNLKIRYI